MDLKDKAISDGGNYEERIVFRVQFGLLPPLGQWAFGESRVQKTVSAPPRTRSVRSMKSVCI